MWGYALLAAAVVAIWWFFRLQNELFCVSVRHGRVLVVRGRIPQSLLNDFADALKNPPVVRGTLRAWRDDGGARLSASGVDEPRQQRLRNILHLYPVSRLVAAREAQRRTLGQLLGLVWLAWLLDRR